MTVPELGVELRQEMGKGAARKLRASGKLPGVIYGGHGQPQPLTVDPLALKKLILAAPSRNFMINLVVDGEPQRAMLKEFTLHPVKRDLVHVDFLRVRADEKVTLEVAVELTGHPAGLAEGGILEVRETSITVTGLPDDLPQMLTADVSGLKLGDNLTVADLSLPAGVEADMPPGTVICAVSHPSTGEGRAREGEAAEEAGTDEG